MPSHARKSHMLEMQNTMYEDSTPFSGLARPAPGAKRVTKIRVVESSVTPNPKRHEWLDQMRRIQSAQDHAAFAEIFEYFAPRVKSFLMKSGASVGMAEECAQEVMVTVWRKAELFDPARASLSTWIFTIARNKKIDALRKQRRPEPEDLDWGPVEEPDAADVFAVQEDNKHLVQAMSELPDEQKELIRQAYFGDLSHGEIAKISGLPLGTIKSRIRLALNKLRQQLK